MRTVGTIFWLAIFFSSLLTSATPDANATGHACVYLLPSYVNNVGQTVQEDLEFDSGSIPTNYTAVVTNLEFICGVVFNSYHEVVVGEIMDCKDDSLGKNTSVITVTDGTRHKSEPNVTTAKDTLSRSRDSISTSITNTVTEMTTTAMTMTNNVTIKTNTLTTNVTDGSYRIKRNITYRNIKDMCPSQEPIYWQREAADWIRRIYPKVLLVIGSIGNTLAFVTIIRMKPVTSTSLLIAVLAINDTCMLIMKNAYFELLAAYHKLSSPLCGFIFWMVAVTGLFAVCLVILMTLERFVAVWFPFRAKIVITKRRTIIAMIVAWVFLMGTNSHLLWTMVHDGGMNCVINPDFEKFWAGVGTVLYALVMSVIPCMILFILNITIIIGMRRSEAMQRKMSAKQEDVKERNQSRQVTIMLLSVSFAFLILSVPMVTFNSIRSGFDPEKKYEYAKLLFIDSITNVFADMNNAVNFYMYFLTGRKFRKQLYIMCGCCRSPKRSPRGTALGMTSGTTSSRATNVSMVSNSSCKASASVQAA